MKRKLSLLLALVMILSLVPMSAFAGSSNRVVSVPTVTKDREFKLGESDLPVLRIEEEDPMEFGTEESEFRLELTNAEWTNQIVGHKVYANDNKAYLTFSKRTDTSLNVKIDGLEEGRTKELVFLVPMLTELQGTGEAKVAINALSSGVSAGTYTFAIGQSGATTATVGSSKTFTKSSNNLGANIIIDEIVANAVGLKEQKFTVRLPKGMEWNDKTEISFDKFGDMKKNVDYTVTTTENSGRDLKVVFTRAAKNSARGSITITPHVDVTKDASKGDVLVNITGTSADISSETGLKIATYKDYGIDIEVEEVIEVFSGRVDDDYIVELTIEETAANSLVNGRDIDFELSSGTKVISGNEVGDLFVETSHAKIDGTSTFKSDKDGNMYESDEWSVKVNRTGGDNDKIKYELEIPITVKGTVTGDVVLTISGAGIEKTEVVIAKAVAPVTVETKVADLRTGVQKQAGPDIIIKENYPGAIQGGSGKELHVQFKDTDFGMRFDDAVFEVIDGDLDIDTKDSEADGDKLIVYVDGESTKASTIKISGIEMTLDRNVPEGPFLVDIKGNAVVQNKDYDDFTSRVARFDYANVVTRADGTIARTSKFVIDSTTYKVVEGNVEVEKTMDVAAFIQDGRTFLPIRYVAESLGVSENNIVWNANTKTVTIMKGDRIATMVIGSKTLTVNGTAVPMDTAAMIKDGRTVLPIRYVAQALGAQIDWDADTRTVTVTQ
ncbi:copper amine oxidase N-terminal domain-containing protein [Geosporobacter ferrireducens]|uniref:copper amine oxidase N-terminal domain-containing protein n=1 Tax=Geosporobacter ferrireducens TaxID=1424294 RepID=UPI00139D3698|nr:copper amine oxidase N-terminal domain-containing protein [Geosporobacter ferrireducens]MTI53305.1 copper amine oxidase N-terminal domain-containing protein [Geosporobacter ferrireducens]